MRTRIEKVWSREGTIYYIKNDAADNKVYKIHSLYDGGQMLGYDFNLSKGALVRLSLEFLMEQVKWIINSKRKLCYKKFFKYYFSSSFKFKIYQTTL